jgi:protein-disulfide isomerase
MEVYMAKLSERRERLRKTKKRNQMIAIAAISAGLILILAVLIVPSLIKQSNPTTADNSKIIMPEDIEYPSVVRNAMGDPNAPVTVEEFSNYGCGHCINFTKNVEPQIIDEYIETGQVYWVYYSFVWTEDLEKAAEANYCAADQDKFFEYRDILFENYGNASINSLNEDNFPAFAEALDMDVQAFTECYRDREHGLQVQKDINYARGLGITGTPTFIVNGELVYADTVEETIQNALNSN